MTPQVFMSKRNGQLAVGLPLFIERYDSVKHDVNGQDVFTKLAWQQHIGWAVFVYNQCEGLWTDDQIDVLPFERLGDL